MSTSPRTPAFWTRVNQLPGLVLGRWFWIPVSGFFLAGTVLSVVVVTATTSNLPVSAWVVWAVVLTCIAAVWAVSRWVVPTGPRTSQDKGQQPRA